MTNDDATHDEDGRAYRWSVGHNMPGYMPDSDPAYFADWSDAKGSLIWELEQADEMMADDVDAATIVSPDEFERLRILSDEIEITVRANDGRVYWLARL